MHSAKTSADIRILSPGSSCLPCQSMVRSPSALRHTVGSWTVWPVPSRLPTDCTLPHFSRTLSPVVHDILLLRNLRLDLSQRETELFTHARARGPGDVVTVQVPGHPFQQRAVRGVQLPQLRQLLHGGLLDPARPER